MKRKSVVAYYSNLSVCSPQLTWDALELPERNCNRLIALNNIAKKKAVEKARADAKKDAEAKEEVRLGEKVL